MDVFPLRPLAVQPVQSSAQAAQERLTQARLFSAEVLQLNDGGSVVLGVGRERIAATSRAALEVGQKLLLKVRGYGSARMLEIVNETAEEVGLLESPSSPVETEHPFRLLAQGRGVGELLADLAQSLLARGNSAPKVVHELTQSLPQFAFPPGEDGPELARHLARSGLAHEARALSRSLDALPISVLASAAEELIATAFSALDSAEEIEPLRAALRQELVRLLSDSTVAPRILPSPRDSGDRFGPALTEWLAPALERISGTTIAASVRAQIVESLLLARIAPRLARAVLVALLGERAELAAVLDSDPDLRPNPLASDLKQWLFDAIEALEHGPEKHAARAAFESLEAEQFLALARATQGDGSSWVFALREGAGFADARLVHERLDESEPSESDSSARRCERAVLGLEFSRTGPVRAELALDANALHVRIGVSHSAVAERLNAMQTELRAALEATGRNVQLSINVCAPESLRVPAPENDEDLALGRAAVDRLA